MVINFNEEKRENMVIKIRKAICFEYITKEQIDTKEVFRAIRNHWQIESNNYLRDCTFREDKIQCFEHKRIKTISVMISLATNLFRNNKTKNIKAQTEKINSKPLMANELLKKIKFL